jgi:hypothetical protein
MSSDPVGHPAGDPAQAQARLALARLDALAGTSVARHPGIFEEVHELLDGVLANLDGSPGPAPAPRPGPGRDAAGPSVRTSP